MGSVCFVWAFAIKGLPDGGKAFGLSSMVDERMAPVKPLLRFAGSLRLAESISCVTVLMCRRRLCQPEKRGI